jgi:hypothetical protein
MLAYGREIGAWALRRTLASADSRERGIEPNRAENGF